MVPHVRAVLRRAAASVLPGLRSARDQGASAGRGIACRRALAGDRRPARPRARLRRPGAAPVAAQPGSFEARKAATSSALPPSPRSSRQARRATRAAPPHTPRRSANGRSRLYSLVTSVIAGPRAAANRSASSSRSAARPRSSTSRRIAPSPRGPARRAHRGSPRKPPSTSNAAAGHRDCAARRVAQQRLHPALVGPARPCAIDL